jgi:hypothetical protein
MFSDTVNDSVTTMDKLGYSIRQALGLVPWGRSKLYDEIKKGNLTVKKLGRRTILMPDELRRYLAALPEKETKLQAATTALASRHRQRTRMLDPDSVQAPENATNAARTLPAAGALDCLSPASNAGEDAAVAGEKASDMDEREGGSP